MQGTLRHGTALIGTFTQVSSRVASTMTSAQLPRGRSKEPWDRTTASPTVLCPRRKNVLKPSGVAPPASDQILNSPWSH